MLIAPDCAQAGDGSAIDSHAMAIAMTAPIECAIRQVDSRCRRLDGIIDRHLENLVVVDISVLQFVIAPPDFNATMAILNFDRPLAVTLLLARPTIYSEPLPQGIFNEPPGNATAIFRPYTRGHDSRSRCLAQSVINFDVFRAQLHPCSVRL